MRILREESTGKSKAEEGLFIWAQGAQHTACRGWVNQVKTLKVAPVGNLRGNQAIPHQLQPETKLCVVDIPRLETTNGVNPRTVREHTNAHKLDAFQQN